MFRIPSMNGINQIQDLVSSLCLIIFKKFCLIKKKNSASLQKRLKIVLFCPLSNPVFLEIQMKSMGTQLQYSIPQEMIHSECKNIHKVDLNLKDYRCVFGYT